MTLQNSPTCCEHVYIVPPFVDTSGKAEFLEYLSQLQEK